MTTHKLKKKVLINEETLDKNSKVTFISHFEYKSRSYFVVQTLEDELVIVESKDLKQIDAQWKLPEQISPPASSINSADLQHKIGPPQRAASMKPKLFQQEQKPAMDRSANKLVTNDKKIDKATGKMPQVETSNVSSLAAIFGSKPTYVTPKSKPVVTRNKVGALAEKLGDTILPGNRFKPAPKPLNSRSSREKVKVSIKRDKQGHSIHKIKPESSKTSSEENPEPETSESVEINSESDQQDQNSQASSDQESRQNSEPRLDSVSKSRSEDAESENGGPNDVILEQHKFLHDYDSKQAKEIFKKIKENNRSLKMNGFFMFRPGERFMGSNSTVWARTNSRIWVLGIKKSTEKLFLYRSKILSGPQFVPKKILTKL